jgi:hypothetical protein
VPCGPAPHATFTPSAVCAASSPPLASLASPLDDDGPDADADGPADADSPPLACHR